MKLRKSILIISLLFLTDIASAQDFSLPSSIKRGKTIYSNLCASCHMANGAGIPGVYSPLTGVDSLVNNKSRLAKSILQGVQGPVKIKGVEYKGNMRSFTLTDQEVSDLLNYIRNSWGNEGKAILPNEIQSLLSSKNDNN